MWYMPSSHPPVLHAWHAHFFLSLEITHSHHHWPMTSITQRAVWGRWNWTFYCLSFDLGTFKSFCKDWSWCIEIVEMVIKIFLFLNKKTINFVIPWSVQQSLYLWPNCKQGTSCCWIKDFTVTSPTPTWACQIVFQHNFPAIKNVPWTLTKLMLVPIFKM